MLSQTSTRTTNPRRETWETCEYWSESHNRPVRRPPRTNGRVSDIAARSEHWILPAEGSDPARRLGSASQSPWHRGLFRHLREVQALRQGAQGYEWIVAKAGGSPARAHRCTPWLAQRFQRASGRIPHHDKKTGTILFRRWDDRWRAHLNQWRPRILRTSLCASRPYPLNMVTGTPLPKRTLRSGYVSRQVEIEDY